MTEYVSTRYVQAPFHYTGKGVLVRFEGGNRVFHDLMFNHHLRFNATSLVLDGCLMATWHEEDNTVCRVKARHIDAMETSSE